MRPAFTPWSRFWGLAALVALLVGVTPHAYAISCNVSQLFNALNNAQNGDTIDLASGCDYFLPDTYSGGDPDNGLPPINVTLTINGNNATIEHSNAINVPKFRLFLVNSGGSLTLNDLTVYRGQSDLGGGGIYVNHGTLTVNNSTISSNSATAGYGGGVYNDHGTVTVINSIFSSNSAAANGGGIYNTGGTLTVSDSTFSGNKAGNGGGVANYQSALVVDNSTFSDNIASLAGGGIENSFSSVTINDSRFTNNTADGGGALDNDQATLIVTNSTFSGNKANDDSLGGGGIYQGIGTVTLNDSTISGSSTAGSGGGIYNFNGTVILNRSTLIDNSSTSSTGGGGGIDVEGGTVQVSNSTLSENSAYQGGGIRTSAGFLGAVTLTNSTVSSNTAFGGGGLFSGSDTGVVQLGSSIIAGNNGIAFHDLLGAFYSLGYNVIGATGGATITGTTTGNLTGAAASPLNLSAWADNGGSTPTMALGAGSVAIGHGNCDTLSGVPRIPSDQRGYPRKSLCDVGAFETEGTTANLIQNGNFSSGITHWSTFGQITDQISGGVFQFYRNSGGASAVVFQGTGHSLPSGAPLIISLDLGNSSNVRKRAVLLVHETDFSDLQVCSFWIPPNTPLRTYQMRTKTTKSWTNATLSVYASPADGIGYLLLDNVDMQYHSELDVHETLCIDPGAPSPGAGADSANLITNGGFSSGLAPWGTFGHITDQISGGVFQFYKTAGTPSGVVLQNTGVPLAGNLPIEAQFQLGNSSAIRMRATILLQAADFSDLQVCTFWVAPGTPLQTYIMRTYSSIAWGGATVSVYPATVAASGWTLLDNVSLLVRPALFVSGTECYLPDSGVVLAAQPVPEIPLTEPPPGAVIGAPPPQVPEVGGQATGETPQHVSPGDNGGLDAPPPGG